MITAGKVVTLCLGPCRTCEFNKNDRENYAVTLCERFWRVRRPPFTSGRNAVVHASCSLTAQPISRSNANFSMLVHAGPQGPFTV